MVISVEEVVVIVDCIGYFVLVCLSYVLGGCVMEIVEN